MEEWKWKGMGRAHLRTGTSSMNMAKRFCRLHPSPSHRPLGEGREGPLKELVGQGDDGVAFADGAHDGRRLLLAQQQVLLIEPSVLRLHHLQAPGRGRRK